MRDDTVTSLWFPESVASAQSGDSCLGQSWGRGLLWFLSYLLSILSDPLKRTHTCKRNAYCARHYALTRKGACPAQNPCPTFISRRGWVFGGMARG